MGPLILVVIFVAFVVIAVVAALQMLNCIVGMVEKTKRAVCALQRGQALLPTTTALAALGDVPLWGSEVGPEKKRPREPFTDPYGRPAPMTMSFNNPAGELESRVSEVRKRAGTEAVR